MPYKDPQKAKEYWKEYANTHRKERYISSKKWREKNKEYQKEWQVKRLHSNPKYRIDNSMGSMFYQALKRNKRGLKWEKLVGYNLKDLMKHLESKFEPWMNWDNYGKWEIDHKKPKSLFKYEKSEDEEFKKCWALENLQPMEKIANRRKYNNLYNYD